MISGACLCGAVSFTVRKLPQKFYRCHCSLCRKQSGTGHNLATLVNQADFNWEASVEFIDSWVKDSGYRNDFCKFCGSTVPNILSNSNHVWLPLGLLDADISVECCGDFCTDNAMSWDCIRSTNHRGNALSSLSELLQLLCLDN